jgi:hypothetical protein
MNKLYLIYGSFNFKRRYDLVKIKGWGEGCELSRCSLNAIMSHTLFKLDLIELKHWSRFDV